jgi:translation initiation factor 2 gamma subunit (eIF-2gamma)
MAIVYVLTTGGTIEKANSERTGTIQNLDSKIDRYLGFLRLPNHEVNVVPLMDKIVLTLVSLVSVSARNWCYLCGTVERVATSEIMETKTVVAGQLGRQRLSRVTS